MKIKSVLVTGTAGFIGYHVSNFLQSKGFSVIPYDLKEGLDLLDEKKLAKSLKFADAVCHLAAVGDVYLAAEKPALAQIAGPAATALLCKLSSEIGICKIIYASTWEVYGKVEYQPIDENHPCLPDHPYSIAKYAGELIVRSELSTVPWVILRLGTAYGEKMRENAVIPQFIKKAKTEKPIIIQGTGKQKRQFTNVADIANAFYLALTKNVNSEIFNITASESISIAQLAKLVTNFFPTKIKFNKARIGDVEPAKVSSQKAQQLLGWRPAIPFKVGFEELIGQF